MESQEPGIAFILGGRGCASPGNCWAREPGPAQELPLRWLKQPLTSFGRGGGGHSSTPIQSPSPAQGCCPQTLRVWPEGLLLLPLSWWRWQGLGAEGAL